MDKLIKISQEFNVTIRVLKSIVTIVVRSNRIIDEIDVAGVIIRPEFVEFKPVDIRGAIINKNQADGAEKFIKEQTEKGIYFVNIKDYTSDEIQFFSTIISKKFMEEIWNLLIKPDLEPFFISLNDSKLRQFLIEENQNLFRNENDLNHFLANYNLELKSFIEPANFNELEIKLKEIEARFQLEQYFARRFLFCSELIHLLKNRLNEFLSNGNTINNDRLKIINDWIIRINDQLKILEKFRDYYKLYDMPEPTHKIEINKSKKVNIVVGNVSNANKTTMIVKELQILAEALWEAVKSDLDFFSAISSFVKKLYEYNYSGLTKENLTEVKIYTKNIEDFFSRYRPAGQRIYSPPSQTSKNDSTVKRITEIIKQLDSMDEDAINNEIKLLSPQKVAVKEIKGGKVFIGHGRSKLWARVQLFLKDELEIESFTFESESRTSESIVDVLEDFLSSSSFAILILTAEDETSDGKIRARQNVIHEAGLFQGRLGFDKVVLLKQDKTEEFSNLAGLQYIPFSEENIEHTFYELRRKLKKSGLIN